MIFTKEQLQELAECANSAATEAGAYITAAIQSDFSISVKENAPSLASQVVTQVDLKAQEIILTNLQASIDKYDLGLLTEESQDSGSRFHKSHFWSIDPLDGTLPFTNREEGYAVAIALVSKAGESLIGVVYDPTNEELFTAIAEDGISCNGVSLSPTSATETYYFISDRSLRKDPNYTTCAEEQKAIAKEHKLIFEEKALNFGAVKSVLALIRLGSGVFCKPAKESDGCGSIWDYAATACIFQELGYRATAYDGSPLPLNCTDTTYMNRTGVRFTTLPV